MRWLRNVYVNAALCESGLAAVIQQRIRHIWCGKSARKQHAAPTRDSLWRALSFTEQSVLISRLLLAFS